MADVLRDRRRSEDGCAGSRPRALHEEECGRLADEDGNARFINTLGTSFNFNKIWLGPDGDIVQPEDYQTWQDEIVVTIGRRAGGETDSDFALKYRIAEANEDGAAFVPLQGTDQSKLPDGEGALKDYALALTSEGNVFNLSLPENCLSEYNSTGQAWEYFVIEDPVEQYAPPQYGTIDRQDEKIVGTVKQDAKAAKNGELIVNKSFGGVELPSTGGPGTRLYLMTGLLLTGFAGAGLLLRRRREAA